MHCPKCYGKIDKLSKRCSSCGFNMNSLNGATHKAVKQAKKNGFGEDVLFTTELPEDIHKKKLLLLCIFLGLFGAHNYYAGKFVKAIYSTIASIILFAISTIFIFFPNTFASLGTAGYWVQSIFSLLMGINIAFFIIDLVNIIRNKFKVSIYKDEFSN